MFLIISVTDVVLLLLKIDWKYIIQIIIYLLLLVIKESKN